MATATLTQVGMNLVAWSIALLVVVQRRRLLRRRELGRLVLHQEADRLRRQVHVVAHVGDGVGGHRGDRAVALRPAWRCRSISDRTARAGRRR